MVTEWLLQASKPQAAQEMQLTDILLKAEAKKELG